MKPGRETDALVAEKVMGRTLLSHEEMLKEATAVWKGQPACQVFFLGFRCIARDPAVFEQNVPRYSTDIAAAWQVVDKITQDYKEVLLVKEGSGHWTFEHEYDEWTASADTAPLAICLGALKAKGVDV